LGGSAPFFGEVKRGPNLTKRRLGQGLPPYQVASWSMQPFGRNGYRPKIGGLCPFRGGELGPHLTQCGQGRGLPACQVSSWFVKPFGHNTPTSQSDRQDRQGSDSIGRTVLQTVAQKWMAPWKTQCATCRMKCWNPSVVFICISSPRAKSTSTHIRSHLLYLYLFAQGVIYYIAFNTGSVWPNHLEWLPEYHNPQKSLCLSQRVSRPIEQSTALTSQSHTLPCSIKYRYMNSQKVSMLKNYLRITFIRPKTSSNHIKQHYTNVPVTIRKK